MTTQCRSSLAAAKSRGAAILMHHAMPSEQMASLGKLRGRIRALRTGVLLLRSYIVVSHQDIV